MKGADGNKWADGNKSDGRQRGRLSGFSISVFGRFTYTLSALDGHYFGIFEKVLCFVVMSAQIRQYVREQPDT